MESPQKIYTTVEERLSALADGELDALELSALLDAMDADPESLHHWTRLHAGMAAVRGEQVGAPSGEAAFWQSLQGKLETGARSAPLSAVMEAEHQQTRAEAANAPFWRLSRLASVAMLLMVGGVAAVLWPGQSEEQSRASVEPPHTELATTSTAAGVMLRDPQLDALMAAHQQMGGHSAWQGSPGFLRSATYERPAR
jgi:sigma-E factor negative regulatory protein RseA